MSMTKNYKRFWPEKFITVIIPTLNEEENIDRVLETFEFEPTRKQLIIVDGGSVDKTVDKVRKFKRGSREYLNLKLIKSDGYTGKGYQMIRGYEEALGLNLVYLDADLDPIGGIGVYDDIDWDGIEGIFWYHENPKSAWGGMGTKPQLPMDNTLPNQSWGLKAGSELGIWLRAAIEKAVVDRPGGLIWLGPSWLGEQVRKFVGADLETPHEEVKEKLAKKGYLYVPYSDLEARAYRHKSLYSWEWDDKLKGKPKQ